MIAELQTAIARAPNRKDRLKNLTNVEAVKIKVERAAILFRGAPIAFIAAALNALIVLAVAWSDIDRGILLSWTGAVIGLSIIRAAVWFRFRARGVSGRNMSRFARWNEFAMAMNGAIWGALAPIFAVHGMMANAFLPFVIAGTTAAAIVSAGASWRSVLAFNIPALTPLAVVYAVTAGPDGLAIAGVVALYGLATAALSVGTQRMIDRSILLHTKNEKLFSALQRKVDIANEAEQRYRALVEASRDVTIIFSPDGKITYASPSAEKALGVPADMIIGRTTRDIVHPDDMPVFRSVGEKSLSQLGEVLSLPHLCLRGGPDAPYAALGGRLTNMLYIPGVEGFVFNGGLLEEQSCKHRHAPAALQEPV